MRIGIFSDSINIPPKEGINVHAYNVATALANHPDVEVLLVICDRGWLDLDVLSEQPFDTLVIPSIDFYDHKKITNIIRTYSLDVLQTYMVYFASLVLGKSSYDTQVPMCLEFHDLEKNIVPLYLNNQSDINFHHDLQYRGGSLASFIRVMSQYDYDVVMKTWPELGATAHWLPVSIKAPLMANRTNFNKKVLFVGNTSYAPNASAADYIQKDLAPALPNITFSLIGRGTEKYTASNVDGYGIVENLVDSLYEHSLGLAPIFAGSGMKIKLLDYLSVGMPVITTTLGGHGYPKSDAILIEDDMNKWPTLIQTLLDNPDELKRISDIARSLFLENFDIANSIETLLQVYRDLPYRALKKPQDFQDIVPRENQIYWLSEKRDTPRQPTAEPRFFKGKS